MRYDLNDLYRVLLNFYYRLQRSGIQSCFDCDATPAYMDVWGNDKCVRITYEWNLYEGDHNWRVKDRDDSTTRIVPNLNELLDICEEMFKENPTDEEELEEDSE